VDQKNSQKSTSSSSNSGGGYAAYHAFNTQDFGGINVQDYMAKCERVIIETEESDRQRKELLKKRESITPAKSDIMNTTAKDEEIIDNFDESKS
jgi:hypothetical protein